MSFPAYFAEDDKALKLSELIAFVENAVKKDPKFLKAPVTYPNFHGYGIMEKVQYLGLHSKVGLILSSELPMYPIAGGDETPVTLQTSDTMTVEELLKFVKNAPNHDALVSTLIWLNETPDFSRILSTHVLAGLCISNK
jgi:hypothetical protein